MTQSAPLIEPSGWSDLRTLIAKRDELGFTRAQVAVAMDAAYTYVCAVERGAFRVSPSFREKYEMALERLIKAQGARATERAR